MQYRWRGQQQYGQNVEMYSNCGRFMLRTEVECGGVDRTAERCLSVEALPTQTARVEDEHLLKLSLVAVGGGCAVKTIITLQTPLMKQF